MDDATDLKRAYSVVDCKLERVEVPSAVACCASGTHRTTPLGRLFRVVGHTQNHTGRVPVPRRRAHT